MLENWKDFFNEEKSKTYYKELIEKVENDRKDKVIYPPKEDLFNAFKFTDLNNIKAVILGQDPYHNEGEAMGLSFSVPKDRKKIPPSLKNIFKEIYGAEYENIKSKINGDLTYLAKQGVLLINATLTVEKNKPNSHSEYGWQTFTDNCIKYISEHNQNVVFFLFGSFAHKKETLINSDKHCIIKTTHPSPFSAHRGFLGSNCFNECNNYLESKKLGKIEWKNF